MAATEARNSRNSFTMGNDRVYNSRVEGSNSFSYPRREESIYSREESIYSRTASINSNEQTLVYSREPELYPRYPEPSPDPTPTPSPEEDELPELPPKAKSVKLVIFDNIRRSVSTVNEAIKEVKKEVTSSKRKSVVTSPVYVAPIVEGLDLGSAPGFLSATTSASVKSNTVKSVYNRLKPDDPDKLVDVEPEEGSNYEFSVAQVAEFRKVFDSFDRNGDESIGVEELGSVLRALGYSPSESDIEKVLSRFDADASGDLSFDEYLALMAVWVEEDETQILEAFKVFDKSGDGFVSISELKRALCRFGEKFTDDEAEEFFELIDANRDGIINYEEFVKYMLSELNRGPPPRAVT